MNLSAVISAVSQDKNLDKAVVIDALEQAILHVAQKDFGLDSELEVAYNEETEEIDLFQFRTVVEHVTDKNLEMTLTEALQLDDDSKMGESIGVRVDTSKFGRIAAQAAKQVIMQKVNEAERHRIYEQYKDKEGEVLSGYVRRVDRRSIVVDLGQVEAIIPGREQIYGEKFRVKDRIQGYVVEVSDVLRGAQIIMSRACNEFLQKLFEHHVTEVYDGVVEIVSIARDPGRRAKIAVTTRDSSVDPVGACVGMKGVRIQAIVTELNGERIDVIPWESDPAVMVCNALSPAVVNKVIVDEENNSMEVVVSEEHLSLAIGKRGQNVRLAAQLTGWALDIRGEISLAKHMEGIKEVISEYVEGSGDMHITILKNEGIKTLEELSQISVRNVVRLLNLSEEAAEGLIEQARIQAEHISQDGAEAIDGYTSNEVTASPISDQVRKQEFINRKKEERFALFMALDGVGEATAQAFSEAGYGALGDIIVENSEEIANRTGLPIVVVKTVQKAAENYMLKHPLHKDKSEDEDGDDGSTTESE